MLTVRVILFRSETFIYNFRSFDSKFFNVLHLSLSFINRVYNKSSMLNTVVVNKLYTRIPLTVNKLPKLCFVP